MPICVTCVSTVMGTVFLAKVKITVDSGPVNSAKFPVFLTNIYLLVIFLYIRRRSIDKGGIGKGVVCKAFCAT